MATNKKAQPSQPKLTLLLSVSTEPQPNLVKGVSFSAPVLTGTEESAITKVFSMFPHVSSVVATVEGGYLYHYTRLPSQES